MDLYYLIPGLCAYLFHIFLYNRDKFISITILIIGILLQFFLLKETQQSSYLSKGANLIVLSIMVTIPNLIFYAVFRFATKFISTGSDAEMFLSKEDLKLVLQDLKGYLAKSEECLLAGHSLIEINDIIDRSLSRIEKDEKVNLSEINLLFLPTGSLQEISLDSGWADDFLELSENYEKSLGKK